MSQLRADGYNDFNRPHGTSSVFVVGNQHVTYYWYADFRHWNLTPPAPSIQVTSATPFSSPELTTSFPVQTASATPAPIKPLSFEQLGQYTPPDPNLSAKFVLEIPPRMGFLQYSGAVYNSSESNKYYGTVGPLASWELPPDLAGYNSLQGLYHYTAPNPMAAGITEGDTVLAAMNAFFDPVDAVLYNNCHGQFVTSSSESTASVRTGEGRAQICRVDRTWAYYNQQTKNWVRFAIIEIKRRGALTASDWVFGVRSSVAGRGEKICRQLKKSALISGTPFVGCCDGEKLVVMHLQGNSEDWSNRTANMAPPTAALARWIESSTEIKRNLYVFLRQALEFKLREHGILQ
jgi:hypothetical protein